MDWRPACIPLAIALAIAPASASGHAQARDTIVAAPQFARAKRIAGSKRFAAARAALAKDYDRIIEELIALTEIPAPPFGEAVRARAFAKMLDAAGLADVEIDAEGNAMGLRRGRGKGPLLVVTAHLDTVFPKETDVKVRRGSGWLHAPGIGDDTAGLATILAYVRALDAAGIATGSDILFMGNVGEEGPGDLRGVRHLFEKGRYRDRIGRFISIESGRGRVINGGIGSRRYQVTFQGPGGHSLHDFGLVNPAYAMAGAIQALGRFTPPTAPRTTFNIGVLEGGTSVNSIPFSVSMLVDMRSEGAEALRAVEDHLMAALPKAVAEENATRSTAKGAITYRTELSGDRPVGQTPASQDIVQAAAAALKVAGINPMLQWASTDSNIPMSRGIPAVTLGSGFQVERVHSLEEALLLDRDETLRHMSAGLATIIAIAGAPLD